MNDLQLDVERFLRTGEGHFDDLALRLFRYQFDLNKPYQAYCLAQGIAPESVKRWQDIPAVPIGAFKSAELATFPIGRAAAVFQSSGTTQQMPSRHFLKTLTYYEISLKIGFERWLLQDASGEMPFLILTPSPGEAPNSSLSWMMDVVKRRWGASDSEYFIQRGRLDDLGLTATLKKAESLRTPVVLLGTTIAFLAFFDDLSKTGRKYQLSPGSRIMDTGGMKTQKRQVSRTDFVRRVGDVFGIPAKQCINEYGMCELSSQFYGRGAGSLLQGPPWVRTLVIDSLTGAPVSSGKTGLLRHFDLANVDSVLAIQTEDVGLMEGDGFMLQGRDPNADLKGCSLAAESFVR